MFTLHSRLSTLRNDMISSWNRCSSFAFGNTDEDWGYLYSYTFSDGDHGSFDWRAFTPGDLEYIVEGTQEGTDLTELLQDLGLEDYLGYLPLPLNRDGEVIL